MNTTYRNMTFSTPLIAQWAAFFDLIEWTWHTNASSVGDWTPDFYISYPCGHSECSGSHELLATVLPFTRLADFGNHPCMKHDFGTGGPALSDGLLNFDGGAALGVNPSVSRWEISHGSGGGHEDIYLHFDEGHADRLWRQAESLISHPLQNA